MSDSSRPHGLQPTRLLCPGNSTEWVAIAFSSGRLPTPVFLGFPCGSAGKESACNVGDLDSIPGLGRSPGEGKGYLLLLSDLENSVDYTVHGVTKELDMTEQLSLHFHLAV